MQQSSLTFETVENLQVPFEQTQLSGALNNTPAKLPLKLYGDQIRLKQVLVNLTKNALKFSINQWVKIKACYDTRS